MGVNSGMRITRMFELFVFIVLSVSLSACSIGSDADPAKTKPVMKPIAWMVSDGLCEPESVVYHASAQRLVVSNLCGFEKNSRGYLSIVNLDGEIVTQIWVGGLNAPAGMAIYDEHLYVADYDRVRVLDVYDGTERDVWGPYPNVETMNDIAVATDGTVFVSGSAQSKVFTLSETQAVPFPNSTSTFEGANGLHVHNGHLYVGSDRLYVINIVSGEISRHPLTALSGIAAIKTNAVGDLSVSRVGGNVWFVPNARNAPNTGKDEAVQHWTTQSLSSAKHAHLSDPALIVVPTGADNTIIAFSP